MQKMTNLSDTTINMKCIKSSTDVAYTNVIHFISKGRDKNTTLQYMNGRMF